LENDEIFFSYRTKVANYEREFLDFILMLINLTIFSF
jgi:hypothetical protein